jgi:hypothetical protein
MRLQSPCRRSTREHDWAWRWGASRSARRRCEIEAMDARGGAGRGSDRGCSERSSRRFECSRPSVWWPACSSSSLLSLLVCVSVCGGGMAAQRAARQADPPPTALSRLLPHPPRWTMHARHSQHICNSARARPVVVSRCLPLPSAWALLGARDDVIAAQWPETRRDERLIAGHSQAAPTPLRPMSGTSANTRGMLRRHEHA